MNRYEQHLIPEDWPDAAVRGYLRVIRKERRRRDRLADRAEFAALVYGCVEDGKVARNTSGMDCDCSQFAYAYLDDPIPFALEHWAYYEDHYDDGPVSRWVSRPSEAVERFSRDLALEAFENGHPHYITTASV